MALHRVDDKTVLNDDEYLEHTDDSWAMWLFVIGAIVTGISIFKNLEFIGLINSPKWVKFTVIISSSVLIGYIFAKLRDLIRTALFLTITISIIGGIGYLIWSQL